VGARRPAINGGSGWLGVAAVTGRGRGRGGGVRGGALKEARWGGEGARGGRGRRGRSAASGGRRREGRRPEEEEAPDRWVPPVGEREREERGVGHWRWAAWARSGDWAAG
jgi:hypothetical protein